MTNHHQVDQLVQVRAQIKALQEIEAALKTDISRAIGDGSVLEGDEWIAEQTLSTRKGGLDEAKLVKAGIDVSQYRKADTTVLTIRTVLRTARAA
jgi:hypothetical protein